MWILSSGKKLFLMFLILSCFGDVWRDASDNTLDYCIGEMHVFFILGRVNYNQVIIFSRHCSLSETTTTTHFQSLRSSELQSLLCHQFCVGLQVFLSRWLPLVE